MEIFGKYIAKKRKSLKIHQKELAQKIMKEDGTSISAQYLNDIERGRRNPPAEHMIRQIADELELPADYLQFLAGRMPEDIESNLPPDKFEAAMKAFRRELNNNS